MKQRNKIKIATAIVVGICVIVGVTIYVVDRSIVQARLLTTAPDEVPNDAELMRYAMSHGQPAYAENCGSCHGGRLQGDPARGIPTLTDDDWLYGSGRISEIERTILYGIRSGNSKGRDLASMPAFATPHPYKQYAVAPLSPQDVDDVTEYLFAFRHKPFDAQAAERGAKIYRNPDKGVCWDCHGADAKGDTAIGAPNLTDSIWLRGDGSRASIYASIARGLAGTCPAWNKRLSPATIRAIAVYVHAVAAQNIPDIHTSDIQRDARKSDPVR